MEFCPETGFQGESTEEKMEIMWRSKLKNGKAVPNSHEREKKDYVEQEQGIAQ